MDFRVNYKDNNNVSTNNVKGNLLQSILLYDSIYIHPWDLPAVVHFFNGRDNAEQIAEKGLLKLINSDDKALGCMKQGQSYSIAGISFNRGSFSSEDEINFMLQSFRGNYSDYKGISKSFFEQSINIKNDDMFNVLEEELYLDISNPKFVKNHRISTKEFIDIAPLDVSFINNRLEAYRRIYFAQAADIKDIFAEDVLVETIKEKLMCTPAVEKVSLNINEEFKKLTKVLKLPNIVEAVEEELFTPTEILKIRDHKHCIEFRNWLHSNAYFDLNEKDNLDVIAAYYDALGKKGLLDKLPVKILRFAVTSSLGFIPGVSTAVELGVSTLDTFLLDKFKIGEWRPQLFFDEYSKLLNK